MSPDPDHIPFSTRADWVKQATSALETTLDPARLYLLVRQGKFSAFRAYARTLFLQEADYLFTDDELRYMFDYLDYRLTQQERAYRSTAS